MKIYRLLLPLILVLFFVLHRSMYAQETAHNSVQNEHTQELLTNIKKLPVELRQNLKNSAYEKRFNNIVRPCDACKDSCPIVLNQLQSVLENDVGQSVEIHRLYTCQYYVDQQSIGNLQPFTCFDVMLSAASGTSDSKLINVLFAGPNKSNKIITLLKDENVLSELKLYVSALEKNVLTKSNREQLELDATKSIRRTKQQINLQDELRKIGTHYSQETLSLALDYHNSIVALCTKNKKFNFLHLYNYRSSDLVDFDRQKTIPLIFPITKFVWMFSFHKKYASAAVIMNNNLYFMHFNNKLYPKSWELTFKKQTCKNSAGKETIINDIAVDPYNKFDLYFVCRADTHYESRIAIYEMPLYNTTKNYKQLISKKLPSCNSSYKFWAHNNQLGLLIVDKELHKEKLYTWLLDTLQAINLGKKDAQKNK